LSAVSPDLFCCGVLALKAGTTGGLFEAKHTFYLCAVLGQLGLVLSPKNHLFITWPSHLVVNDLFVLSRVLLTFYLELEFAHNVLVLFVGGESARPAKEGILGV